MKRLFCAMFAVLAALGLAACTAPATAAETDSGSAKAVASAFAPEVVTFADPTLEAMVRGSMGRPEGDITAAEAEAVTELNLSFDLRRYLPDTAQIRDIGGLEHYKNLEHLDLSFHAISDISPLSGLTKIVSLSLSGNPVADVTPISGLTGLKALSLSGCAAEDYSVLSNLTSLELLALDHSTIADVSPLSTLTGLKVLYLAGSPASDYSPLVAFYSNLEERDFSIITSLQELGFAMDSDKNQAYYGDVQRDGLSVNINHAEWGPPGTEDMTKCVKLDLMLDSGYILTVLYYPEISAYCFQMNIYNEQMNYVYSMADGTIMMDSNNRERFERMITEALGETGEADVLLAPIPVFDDTIRKTFGMTADALYALPMK